MFDFGDELTLESYKIPWLVWIQLIVLLLLLALFFLLSLDDSTSAATSSTTSSSASVSASAATRLHKSLTNHGSISTALTNRLQNTRGVENLSIKGEIETSGSTRIVTEEIAEREASPLYFLHPCHYFKLARVAFLKCLGLDCTSESDGPPNRIKHRKRKERKES